MLVAAIEQLHCPACWVVFAVRPDWDKLATEEARQCAMCRDTRTALNAVVGHLGWPNEFDGIVHETCAATIRTALGAEWASAYRRVAWLEENELASDRGGSRVCRTSAELLDAINGRLPELER